MQRFDCLHFSVANAARGAENSGYWGPDGWVPPASASAPSNSGLNKGAVVGLSVAGAVVGLISLFTAGILIRKRLNEKPASEGIVRKSSSSVRRGSSSKVGPEVKYTKLAEAPIDDTELNPLMKVDDEEHPATAATTAPAQVPT